MTDAATIDALATEIEAARDALFNRAADAARAFVVAETLAYSAAHPRRKVTFCAAMGSTTLHVAPGGTCAYRGEYQFKDGESDIGPPLEWLATLERLDEIVDGKGWLSGPLLLVCQGGKIVSQTENW